MTQYLLCRVMARRRRIFQCHEHLCAVGKLRHHLGCHSGPDELPNFWDTLSAHKPKGEVPESVVRRVKQPGMLEVEHKTWTNRQDQCVVDFEAVNNGWFWNSP